jgi:poly-beta-hydroxyalkanoate depolymerase
VVFPVITTIKFLSDKSQLNRISVTNRPQKKKKNSKILTIMPVRSKHSSVLKNTVVEPYITKFEVFTVDFYG